MFENLRDYENKRDLSSPSVVRTLIDGEDDDGEVDVLTLLTYIKCKSKSTFALA